MGRREEHPCDEMATGGDGAPRLWGAAAPRTEGTVNADTNDRAASERVERLERALKGRARRLEILDRQAVARRETEDRRLQQEER
jgi:hypothetical protein